MSTPMKLIGFVAALAVVFAGLFVLGRTLRGPVSATDPVQSTPPAGHGHPGTEPTGGHDPGGHESGSAAPDADARPAESRSGFTLHLLGVPTAPGRQPLTFKITGPTGEVTTQFEQSHTKELHLIVVREDLSGFQHFHPTRGADGVWTATVTVTAGRWRVYADSVPAALKSQIVLSAPFQVAGVDHARPLPAPARTATVDGYQVRVHGDL